MSQFKLSKRKKCKTCSEQSFSLCDNELHRECKMEQRQERRNHGNGTKIMNISIFVAIIINCKYNYILCIKKILCYGCMVNCFICI